MKRADIVEGFKKREKLWRYGDATGLAWTYTPDATIDSPIFGELRGRAEIETSFQELLKVFHGWSCHSHDLVVEGDRAVQTFHLQGMHSRPFFGVAPTWLKLDVKGVMFVRFVGDQIAHEQRVYDFSKMMVQLGILKP